MTVIALKDGVLACDRLHVNGHDLAREAMKLVTGDGYAAAGMGDLDECDALHRWYRERTLEFPVPREWADPSGIIVVCSSTPNMASYYSRYAEPTEYPGVWAWGSGAEVALGAMAAGASAEEACEIACRLVTTCGGDVDSVLVPSLAP